jgi:glyoxylase-like metal-dependent hydrolase (beta-lactamase superfamily II)
MMKHTSACTEILRLQLPTPFNVGPVNVFLLKGESCTLVDAGPKTKEAFTLLESFLQQNGLVWHDIDRIFLTHQHVDHTGLTAEIVERTNARVIAHPDAVPYIEMDEVFMNWHNEFYLQLYKENGVPVPMLDYVARFHEMMQLYSAPAPVHQMMQGGERLEGCGVWQTVFTPGHTQNHLALYREQDGCMISGDFLLKDISSNAFVEPPRRPDEQRAKPLLVYRKAMQDIMTLPIRRMLSSHGEEIINPQELMQQRLQRQEERAEKIYEMLVDGAKTVFELSALLFPSLYLKELPLTFSETLGHLDLLVEQGRVEERWSDKDGVYRYHQMK